MLSDDKKRKAKRKRILEALRQGCTLQEASQAAGISSRTLQRWRNADPELAEAVADVMDEQDDAVEAVTLKNCLDPDAAHNTLRIFWLKSRRPGTYREQVGHTHTGTVNLVWTDDENRESGEA